LNSIWIPQNYKERGRTFFFFLGTPVVKGRTILCNNDLTLKVTNFIFDTLILFSEAGLRLSSPQEIHNAQIHKLFQQKRDLNLQMIAGFIPCFLATLSHTQSLLPMQRAYNLGRVSIIWSQTRATSCCVC
jgi:amino acid permease